MAAKLTTERRHALLRELHFDHGHAGDARDLERHRFFPVDEHLRALDPEIVFVVGPRGAGKSRLMTALAREDTRTALVRRADVPLPSNGGTWITGFPYGTIGPSHRAWEAFAQAAPEGGMDRVQSLWFALLVRVLEHELTPEERRSLAPVFDRSRDADGLYHAFRGVVSVAEQVLDALELRLQSQGRFVFVTYDELDTLFYTRWTSMLAVLQGLTALWAGYYRRWRSLRAKLFVRTDLYEESSALMSSDVAKMAARRVELHWSTRNLYGALFQHIVNTSGDLRAFFANRLELEEESGLGFVPRLSRDADARLAVERLCGLYMGANSNKGFTVNWLINAIRDGSGRVSPRNLIQLLENAAQIESDRPRAGKKHQLLHHISLRNALTKVSEEHVRTATSNEYPWLLGLHDRLAKSPESREVPWLRRRLEVYLSARWDDPWSASDERPRPPAATPAEFVDRLLRLGIFRERTRYDTRTDVAIDAPDLYLEGLKLLRRGGVART